MGDTGTLPATGTVSNKVPEMGATEPMTNTGSHTMGDTGTLPQRSPRAARFSNGRNRPSKCTLSAISDHHPPLHLAACLKRSGWSRLTRSLWSIEQFKKQAEFVSPGGPQMSDLVVIVYPTEAKAEEMRTKLFSLQKEYLIDLGDAVIAVKREDGKVKLNQLINTTADGALSGGLWGTLVGMIFLMPCREPQSEQLLAHSAGH